MNLVTRGVRNAFRNSVRTLSIVIILGLSIGLALTMLVANQAVSQKIKSVQSSVGNTINVSPAGARGFEGGGNALTQDELSNVQKLTHVTTIEESLADRLTTDNTNLQSAVDAGTLGQRFSARSGETFMPPQNISFRTDGGAGGDTGIVSFTPPVTVNGTTNPTDLSSGIGGGTFSLKSGQVFSNNSTDDVALIGTTLATKNNLSVGSTFTAYGTTIKVVGIFDAGNAFSNDQVIMPLATVQKLSSQPGAITSATISIDSVTNIDSVTKAVQNTLGSAADVTNGAEQAKETIAPLENIKSISLYSLIGAVAAGAIIILLTMVMIVRERRREIGVLKAIGASNVKVILQFMSEAVTFTLLSAVIGLIVGALGGNPVTRLLVNNSTSSTTTSQTAAGPVLISNSATSSGTVTRAVGGGGFARRLGGGAQASVNSFRNIHAAVGWSILLYGLGAALLIAIVGSAFAAGLIAKVRPAEVMRAE